VSTSTPPAHPSAGAIRAAHLILHGPHISHDGIGNSARENSYVLARIIDRETRTDLTPEQIADALRELARRDQVGIYVDTHKGRPCYFHVVETRDTDQRDGVGPTYDAALAACRAAEFKETAK